MNDGATTTGTVTFNNSMRNKNYDNSQFFRTSNLAATLDNDKHRIWLDLVDSESKGVRTLVGYLPEASYGIDRLYDANKNIANDLNIYSIVEDQTLVIQGRATPFDENDRVVIGINIKQEGAYKIAIGAVDGLFADAQPIYIEDKLLSVIHDLRNSPYNFTSVSGNVVDRFMLRYTTNALSTPTFSDSNVVVYKNEEGLFINAGTNTMECVKIYDVQGRLITSRNNINASEISFTTLPKTQQVLFVTITNSEGISITKKVVF